MNDFLERLTYKKEHNIISVVLLSYTIVPLLLCGLIEKIFT